jgi:Zn-finger nucleic acid-binding protein
MCDQKMRETTIGQKPEIIVDACMRGHGLWFDGGEVVQLLRQLAGKQPAGQDAQQQIISFLGETFRAET